MTCEACGGSRWREVQERYAEHLADQRHDREQEPDKWRAAYGAALNSVYPCKECQPSVFWRWANGHFDPQHDRAACPECTTPKGAKRSQRAIDRPPPPPEPPPAYDDLETRT